VDRVSKNFWRGHRIALEEWCGIYRQYIEAEASEKEDLRKVLDRHTDAADHALSAANYHVGAQGERGISSVMAALDKRQATGAPPYWSRKRRAVLGGGPGEMSWNPRDVLLETVMKAIGVLKDRETGSDDA
jgi:hypothetical protein